MCFEILCCYFFLQPKKKKFCGGNKLKFNKIKKMKENTPKGLCVVTNNDKLSELNCAIHCLMNTSILNHFVENEFKIQINRSNVLGTGGVLGSEFGELCKKYYFVNSFFFFHFFKIKLLILFC